MLSFGSWCSGKRPWKSAMKSRAFLFESLLDWVIDRYAASQNGSSVPTESQGEGIAIPA